MEIELVLDIEVKLIDVVRGGSARQRSNEFKMIINVIESTPMANAVAQGKVSMRRR